MGKKGHWFSALKRAFSISSKDSSTFGSDNKYVKTKKKWGTGRSKNTDVNSFIPLYREPSSIEKILGDADLEEQHSLQQEPPKRIQHFHSPNEEFPKKFQHFQEPRQEPSKCVKHFRAPKSKPKPTTATSRRASNMSYVNSSAIKIQTAYRGYMARKTYPALKGLLRLQKMMRGRSVNRQTINTMRCMQLLVRVQSQVRARRLHMIESKNLQHPQHTPRRSEMEIESNFSRWNRTPQVEAEVDGEWDDSMLTKEEREMRIQRKVEAGIKRERALAYAYSHKLLKVTPKSAHAVLTDIRSGGSPWWWNWLDRQLPSEPLPKTPTLSTPKFASTTLSATNFQSRKHIFDPPTPRSWKPMPCTEEKKSLKSSYKWNQTQLGDGESLASFPALRPVPNYMAPTVSTKAKVRENRDMDEGGKKLSFSLTQSIGNLFVWKEKVDASRVSKGKHRSSNSVGRVSVDSTVSLPVAVGKKAFK